jgi:hypothetical protein
MHVLVNDVHAWWQHIASLDLAGQFGVSSPGVPRVEPWGLTVAYLFDPSGVLWHFAESTKTCDGAVTPAEQAELWSRRIRCGLWLMSCSVRPVGNTIFRISPRIVDLIDVGVGRGV